MTAKRARNDIYLVTKYEIVKQINQGIKQFEIAKKFNLNESTVCRIKKDKDRVTKEYECGLLTVATMRKRMFDLFPVNKALFEWFTILPVRLV